MSILKVGDRVVWKRHEGGKENPEFFDAIIIKIDSPVTQIETFIPAAGKNMKRTVHIRNLTLWEESENKPPTIRFLDQHFWSPKSGGKI